MMSETPQETIDQADVETSATVEAELIEVRATIGISGRQRRLSVGDRALVDPTDPYIAKLIDRQVLVPIETP